MDNNLISRSEIERKIEDCFDAWLTGVDCSVCASEIYTSIIDAITKQPAVDAEPVQHGEWELNPCNIYNDATWVCSECGNEWVLMDDNPSENQMNYCPNCGAKMDGRTDDGQIA